MERECRVCKVGEKKSPPGIMREREIKLVTYQVFFHRGFACTWHVTKPMTKHYAYYGEVIYFFLIF